MHGEPEEVENAPLVRPCSLKESDHDRLPRRSGWPQPGDREHDAVRQIRHGGCGLPPVSPAPQRPPSQRPTIGWREWVILPEFEIPSIKAKVDTGARTSSLHAFDIEPFLRGEKRMVQFKVHPEQRDSSLTITAEAPLSEHRAVKPSSGESQIRPVILTTIEVLGERFEVELTLTRRDEMGFRMLLGRQALRGRFLVDPARSYLGGRRAKGLRRLARRARKPGEID